MLDAIKTIGSFLAIITAIFLIADRLFGSRPICSLSKPDGSTEGYLIIRVSNVSLKDIVILRIAVSPRAYGIARTDSLRDVLGAAMDANYVCLLRPKADVELPFVRLYEDDHPVEDKVRNVLVQSGDLLELIARCWDQGASPALRPHFY